jgi:uncharacterized hydrophobic protein (TIGR00271 family)
MLELRVYVPSVQAAAVGDLVAGAPGISHVRLFEGAAESLLTAELESRHGDDVIERLTGAGVPADAIRLIRETVIPVSLARPATGADTSLIWADLIAEARTTSRPAVRYLVLMAVAGVIAAFGVLQASGILIVGAMAVSPDLLPVAGICVGLVARRPRLFARSLGTLAIGLLTSGVVAFLLTAFLEGIGWLGSTEPSGTFLGTLISVDLSSVIIAAAAGIAAMLSFETRAQSAVGVAISVTTIPAVSYFGVALAVGHVSGAGAALAVLGVNVVFLVCGGAFTLAVQRLARRWTR